MNTDMSLIERWPQAVTLDITVHYDRSAPDRRSYLLAPSAQASEVRVLIPQHTGQPLELQRVCWSELPGRTLYLRCLQVLAVHLFGAVTMPPRVCGAPLWQHISVGISTHAHSVHQLHFELEAVDDTRAALCYRAHHQQPLTRRALALDKLDADPLRALLRVGATSVRPVLMRSAVPAHATLSSGHRPAAALSQAHTARLP